ncbi:cyclic nucleotide-gated cation channel alpha-4 [Acipenser ruthenus]|uniref:cyclic nucleotide-gated cation channel alpha-4 n=1 Tax=Acipenser ruthenus TaxID=7906 RepID=UPI0027427153|nr:cyclic nucleotide-gated cation channel alpha-4 [Acipenser ruthenus]
MNQWSGFFRRHQGQIKEEVKKEARINGTKAAVKKSWKEWTVDPSSDVYFNWLKVMVFPVLYNWVIIIFRTCFMDMEYNYLPVWLTLDYLSDLLYVVDVIIKFNTGFLEHGIMVQERSRLNRRYLHTSEFFFDALSLLPTDLLYLWLGIHCPMVRINRFLRIPRLFEAFDRMETRTSYPNSFRLCKLMLYTFVLIHWNSCGYFALSRTIGFGVDPWVYPNITDPDFASELRQYIYSFWISTLVFTTVGDTPVPEREEEYLFMIADLLIAVLVFASIVGNVGNVITNLNNADNAFFPNHELVKSYMKTHRVNKDLQTRVNGWYQHLHINKKMTRENEILQLLPDRLRAEVAVSVHMGTLSKVTIFQNCEMSLLEELVLKLKPQVYSPREYVCKKGDIGHEMYIIKEGKLAVVADDGVTEFAVLGEGNFFGEISILNIKGNKSGNRRTANIRSIGHSDLFCLSKEDLKGVLTEFPDAKRILEEKGRQILMKMGILDESMVGVEEKKELTVSRLNEIEGKLDSLQTKLARLLAELESNTYKLRIRLEQLENETSEWELPKVEHEKDGEDDGEGEVKGDRVEGESGKKVGKKEDEPGPSKGE